MEDSGAGGSNTRRTHSDVKPIEFAGMQCAPTVTAHPTEAQDHHDFKTLTVPEAASFSQRRPDEMEKGCPRKDGLSGSGYASRGSSPTQIEDGMSPDADCPGQTPAAGVVSTPTHVMPVSNAVAAEASSEALTAVHVSNAPAGAADAPPYNCPEGLDLMSSAMEGGEMHMSESARLKVFCWNLVLQAEAKEGISRQMTPVKEETGTHENGQELGASEAPIFLKGSRGRTK